MNTACPYALYLGRLAPNSQRSIASQLNSIAEMLEWPAEKRQMMFHQIDYQQASHIKAMLLAKGWSPRSINRAMAGIRNIVKVAVIAGLASERQAVQLQAITRIKHGNHKGTPLSTDQVAKLFKVLANETSLIGSRNAAIFAVLLGVGIRRSELVALRLSDYSLDERTLYIRKGKGNKSRTVYLPTWSCDALQGWISIRGDEEGALFLRIARGGGIQQGSQLSTSFIYTLIRKTLAQIGVNNASPHDLRRTFITRLLEQNVDLNTVRQMAGHADIATTIMYDKRDHAAMQQAASMLSYGKESE